MRNSENRWGTTIAISTPESPDLTGLGTTIRHLARAMEKMAIHLLSFGSGLPCGGDPRQRGVTEQLFVLVDRCDGSRLLGADRVTAYLPWPACATLSFDEYHGLSERLGTSTEVKCLGHDGTVLADSEFLRSQCSLAPHGTATKCLSPIRPDALNNGLTYDDYCSLARTLNVRQGRGSYTSETPSQTSCPQPRFIDYGK